MKSHSFYPTVFALVLALMPWEAPLAQTPPATLRLLSKVRDFPDLQNHTLPGNGYFHPDFNTYETCAGKGYVNALIDTNGLVDTATFPGDNRNPAFRGAPTNCITGLTSFNDWFNDRATTINRPFLYEMVFNRNAQGMYEYINNNFFPLDNDSLAKPGTLRPLPGGPTTTFGHRNTVNQGGVNTALHNYGFTTEFHAKFTYFAATPSRPAQEFNFTGDDDVWVFINGRLAIDLGGIHAAQSDGIVLDAATAQNLGGLVDGQSYTLDFFLAERRIVASNCRITTSLQLVTQKVDAPIADPSAQVTPQTPNGYEFRSNVPVTLRTITPATRIFYTTDGTTPDSSGATSKEYIPGVTPPIIITATTTLKAIAYKAGWNASDVTSVLYTKVFTPTTIEILDQNGNALPGYITEINTPYTIKLTTTQYGLPATISADATTKIAADAEKVALTTTGPVGDYTVYTGKEPLLFGTAVANDGKSQSRPYDTLIVKWTNPSDPARDTAVKRIWVRPAKKQAQVYFSTDSTGATSTNTFAGTETRIYVFVVDQILPGNPPAINLATTPTGTGRTPDNENIGMAVTSTPGLYRAVVTVEDKAVSAAADLKLQLQIGDFIKATYVDPLDGDTGRADAGYGVPPEIGGTLSFTDKNWNVLANGVYYSPAEGFLYLQYKDDYLLGKDTVIATLSIVNNKGVANADGESFPLDSVLLKKSGTIGVWEGSIKLIDGPRIRPNNDTAETYVLGEVHAEVASHDKAGGPLARISDDLLVAYENKVPTISIEGSGGPGVSVKRGDPNVVVTITDQSISSARDTVYFNISCSNSRDGIVNMMAIETEPGSGIYKSVPVAKAEGTQANDAVLQCLSRDLVKVDYTDPVYNEKKSDQVEIHEPIAPRIAYSSDRAGMDIITSVSDADADSFYVVVTARNADINAVDKITVTLSIGTGETETFEAVETGNSTNTFIVAVPFTFAGGATQSGNRILEGKLTSTNTTNVVTAIGKVNVDGSEATGAITLEAAYDPVKKAYIKDTDGDGKGDKVYITFENRLPRFPDLVTAKWNSDTLASKTATKAKISFLNADSTTIVVDFTTDEFGKDLTSADTKNPPRAVLPGDALFKGQNPVIEDSIGPIIVSAEKRPVNPNLVGKGDPTLNRDTLIVKLSEPLKTADLREILKFSGSCSDYGNARTITAVSQPSMVPGEPATYIVIVDNSGGLSPSAGRDCIFLNADGKYTDFNSNIPTKVGVKLGGKDGNKIIELFRGYPPVAGLDPNKPIFQVSVQDSRDSTKGGYATEIQGSPGTYAVYWIPPIGFDPNRPGDFRPYTANINDLPSGTESQEPVTLPPTISTVQVVSKEPYIAHIAIFDNLGNFVRRSVQAFGFRGELQNDDRIVPKGRVSYLVWDRKDTKGQTVGTGVYVWKVQFQFKGGKQEVQYTRTGIMRN